MTVVQPVSNKHNLEQTGLGTECEGERFAKEAKEKQLSASPGLHQNIFSNMNAEIVSLI